MKKTNPPELVFERWFLGLKKYNGFPARGTISGALVVLDRLKTDFNLSIDAHTAKGGSQIKGASGATVAAILKQFGEIRHFVSEGGRTNRGLRGDVHGLLGILKEEKLESISSTSRNVFLKKIQRLLVDKVRDFHNRQRISFTYSSTKTGWQVIHDVLENAAQEGKRGPVAEHLVGAKLTLRFPDIKIRNKSYSAADEQAGEQGDFKVGDTVFHVTVSPMAGVYEKCKRNLDQGFRVYLIVPEELVVGTRQNTEQLMAGKIAVVSVESFVSQNIEEISIFTTNGLKEGFYRLFDAYNQRVNTVESDKSLQFEIPQNLLPKH